MLMAFALRAANRLAAELERRAAPSIPSTRSTRGHLAPPTENQVPQEP
jgi:hypothetical protein